MKQNLFFVQCVMLIAVSNVSDGQNGQSTTRKNWSVAIEETHKVFIENKGQFDDRVLYGINYNGIDIYFTASGITYKHNSIIKTSEEEKKEAIPKEKRNEQEKERGNIQSTPLFLNMQWLGANPNPRIIAEDAVSNYFTYGDLKDKTGKSTIKANAYKKITYKNIYPNIDVEYVFPENKTGIKYSITLHPGANLKAIQMQYDGAEKLYTDAEDNLMIESLFGEFIDHAPKTFYKEGTIIKSSFELSGNIVSFKLNELSNLPQETIIIDPWTTIPTFTGTNKAYDIDWDYQGNVYIFGATYPYQLSKINSSGIIQWTHNSILSSYYYGDFAIDRNTGTAYLCEGYTTPGAHLEKVNTLGNWIGYSIANPNSTEEYWRIAYNSCTHVGVIGAGGTSSTYQACTFDTNLNVTSVNVLAATDLCRDMSLLALDDTNCYMATTRTTNTTNFNFLNNAIIKCPLPALLPLAYMVPDGYTFWEAKCIKYYPYYGNGFNGMTKNSRYLYTYDGATIKKWNPWSGAFISSVIVSAADSFRCGGIVVDACNNVYVGTITGVKQYDSTFTFVTSAPTIDTVYDVAMGISGEIFACGNGFVSALSLFSPCSSFSISTSSTNSTCSGNDGTATITITGGAPPFTYSWTPGGQTTSTVTGLAPGTYTITIQTNNIAGCSNSGHYTTTVSVSAITGFTQQSNICTPVTCNSNNNGTATETIAGGTTPYTFLWMPGGQSTQTATGLSAGTYTVLVKDNAGCKTIDSVKINSNALTATIAQTNLTCNGIGNGTASVTIAGNTPPYTYLWNTSPIQTTNTAIGLSAITYTCTISDVTGCQITETVTITQPSAINISINSIPTCANNTTGTASAIPSLGISPYTYLWNSSPPQTTPTATGLASGTYTVTVTDGNSCTQTQTIIVASFLPVTTTATTSTTTITYGQNATLTANGGVGYSWSNGNNGNIINVAPTTTTVYCVTATDTNNCSDTACVTVFFYDVCASGIYLPNAFSPNNDGENDFLQVYYENILCVTSLHMIIYDRWGENLFESTDPAFKWDGSYFGKIINTQVVTYYLKATLIDGKEISKKGKISLVR